VLKQTRRRWLVAGSLRVGFGPLARIPQALAPHGWQINTAVIERLTLTLRQPVAAAGRRVVTLCKHEAGLRQQLALYPLYYNCWFAYHRGPSNKSWRGEPSGRRVRRSKPCVPAGWEEGSL
jgi:hypothetical protein